MYSVKTIPKYIIAILIYFLKDTLNQKYGERKELHVLLNDVPSNDFKSVWNNIHGMDIILLHILDKFCIIYSQYHVRYNPNSFWKFIYMKPFKNLY